MAVWRGVSVASTVLYFLMLVALPRQAWCVNSSQVTTTCGQQVTIPNAEHQHLMVNLTFSQPPASGVVDCSWLIPSANASMSSQIMLTGHAHPDTLTCGMKAFSVAEKNPQSGALNPVTLECFTLANVTHYSLVVGQPGFTLVVTLNTTLASSSALSENFMFMHVVPFVWNDSVCPREERKVVIAMPGDKDTLSPGLALAARYPDNMLCKWELRSHDAGMVHLEIMTSSYYWDSSDTCGGGDYFVVTDGNETARTVIVPLCEEPGVRFLYTSTTGTIYINLVTDSSGGAFQSFFFRYWSVQSCPSSELALKAYVGEKYHLKGSSFSSEGAGHKQQCWWHLAGYTNSVITLYNLDASEFQQNCNDSTDYLTVDSRKVSICDKSEGGGDFPLWSESKSVRVVFHSQTQLVRRSFFLDFAAVFQNPCQGNPYRRTVEGFGYTGEYVVLMPIKQDDIASGPVCQWIFTAKDAGKTVQVSVNWAEDGSPTARRGVPFNRTSCTFPNFQAYNGDDATVSSSSGSVEIRPTCSEDRNTIIYSSSARSMVFTYQRQPHRAESGFSMGVNQVQQGTSGGSSMLLLPGADRASSRGWTMGLLMVMVWGVLLLPLVY